MNPIGPGPLILLLEELPDDDELDKLLEDELEERELLLEELLDDDELDKLLEDELEERELLEDNEERLDDEELGNELFKDARLKDEEMLGTLLAELEDTKKLVA